MQLQCGEKGKELAKSNFCRFLTFAHRGEKGISANLFWLMADGPVDGRGSRTGLGCVTGVSTGEIDSGVFLVVVFFKAAAIMDTYGG